MNHPSSFDDPMKSSPSSLPEVRSPAFQAEAHRQSLAVATSAQASDDQAFINAISDQGDA